MRKTPPKNPKIFIRHILESIAEIEKNAKNKPKRKFLSSITTQDAIIRRLEIIGEAVKNLPTSIKRNHPDIPWKNIAGTRDILIHEYFGVDLNVVWDVIKNDIPKLKKQIKKLLNNL